MVTVDCINDKNKWRKTSSCQGYPNGQKRKYDACMENKHINKMFITLVNIDLNIRQLLKK